MCWTSWCKGMGHAGLDPIGSSPPEQTQVESSPGQTLVDQARASHTRPKSGPIVRFLFFI